MRCNYAVLRYCRAGGGDQAPHRQNRKQARPYLCKDQEGQTADMTIDVTEQRVTDAMAEHPEMNRDDWYYMLTGSDFTPSC